MKDEIRLQGGDKPGGSGGFATPHVPGVPESEPDTEVNDSLGSIHPADTMDTMDTDPKDDKETAGKPTTSRAGVQ